MEYLVIDATPGKIKALGFFDETEAKTLAKKSNHLLIKQSSDLEVLTNADITILYNSVSNKAPVKTFSAAKSVGANRTYNLLVKELSKGKKVLPNSKEKSSKFPFLSLSNEERKKIIMNCLTKKVNGEYRILSLQTIRNETGIKSNAGVGFEIEESNDEKFRKYLRQHIIKRDENGTIKKMGANGDGSTYQYKD